MPTPDQQQYLAHPPLHYEQISQLHQYSTNRQNPRRKHSLLTHVPTLCFLPQPTDVVTNNGILRLVINLDRSPERMRSISQQLVARDLHFERLPAVDGRKLAQEELSRLEAPYDAPEKFVFRKALWPNEIACFLSHTACWKKLVKSGCEWGVIMEDDIVLSPRFKLFATSSEWIPEGVRVIQLHGSHQSFAAGESYPVRDTELCRILNPTPLCSFAYLMHRESAAYAVRD